MKFKDKMVCFQEVPDETSLSYSITGCSVHCKGCHSQYLWDRNSGYDLFPILKEDLKVNQGLVTCILFLGGDDEFQHDELVEAVKMAKKAGYKTALYTGYEFSHVSEDLISLLDYLKVGPYIEERGGLKDKTTNQIMYKITHEEDGSTEFENITSRFWDRKITAAEL